MTTKELFESMENVSLRKLAIATDISYGVMLKASKKPVPGVAYDPAATNFDEIDKLLAKREINLDDMNLADLETTARTSALTSEGLKIGEKYTIRGNDEPWELIAFTTECVCIQQDELLRSMSINTFLHQTPKLVSAETVAQEDANA